MLAKAIDAVPEPDRVDGGLSYEPKWDGFRGIVSFDGETVEIGSRGAKPLTRYFPELTEALSRLLPEPCVLDGEIVVPHGEPGSQRLDWEALSQRIHPAESRIRTLSVETPALFVAFDLLRLGSDDLMGRPFGERRAALEQFAGGLPSPLHVTRATPDVTTARRWLEQFEGAGLDGVVAKPLAASYAPGKRALFKIKHHRTADVVVLGYRVHKSGTGVGSLLVGLYDETGRGSGGGSGAVESVGDAPLRGVGGISAFSDVRRRELVDELAPLVERDDAGGIVTGEGERNRFSSSKDVSFVRLRPERVVEVRYDQMEGSRFRHTVQFERWRPDRDPRSCIFEQLDLPSAYDLGDVLV
jgi:ATP-dependent DNA ligase